MTVYYISDAIGDPAVLDGFDPATDVIDFEDFGYVRHPAVIGGEVAKGVVIRFNPNTDVFSIKAYDGNELLAALTVAVDPFTLTSANFQFADGLLVIPGDNTGSTASDDAANNHDYANEAATLLFKGFGGNDQFVGGIGNDTLYGDGGADTLNGGRGDDRIIGVLGNDLLLGGVGQDTLFGHFGDDRLLGGEGADLLLGQDGNDRLFGQGGDDHLRGVNGADSLFGGTGQDLIFGMLGNDRLKGDQDADTLYGGPGHDAINGGTGDDVLWAGGGNDVARGDAGADIIYGQAGNDRLYGHEGDDLLYDNLGADILGGGSGNDTLVGGNGPDRLYGHTGDDVLFGNRGADILFGRDGADTLNGGFDNDIIRGGSGDDLVRGGPGANRLFGGGGADTLIGGVGPDFIVGGPGNDFLHGTAGADTLNGVAGDDTLFGGLGADLFILGSGNDVIADFAAIDSILLEQDGWRIDDNPNGAVISLADGNIVTVTGSSARNVASAISGTGTPAPVGDKFQVNTFVENAQVDPSSAAFSDGRFVVIWSSEYRLPSDGSAPWWEINGQLFDNEGNSIGSEFQVSSNSSWSERSPSVTELINGGFVVTWTSADEPVSGIFDELFNYGIYGQLFDDAGNPIGAEFMVNSEHGHDELDSSVAALSDGGFVVTWSSREFSPESGFGYNRGVYGQRFDNEGNVVGPVISVEEYTGDYQDLRNYTYSSVTGLSDGGFVVTWDTDDGSHSGIHGQRYDEAGNLVGAEFQVNTFTEYLQYGSTVTALSDGGFVITWRSVGQGTLGQTYDATGKAIGAEFQLPTSSVSVSALSDNGFVVTWVDEGIYGQRYDGLGNMIGIEFQVNNTGGSPSVTVLSDGGLVAIWKSGEIYAQLFQIVDVAEEITEASLSAAAPMVGEVTTLAVGDVSPWEWAPV